MDVIQRSNIVTGKNPIKVEVTNPLPPGGDKSGQKVNLAWTQEQGDIVEGKATVNVKFKVDEPLNLPAFIAFCDKPCKTTGAWVSIGIMQVGFLGGLPNVAGALYQAPRPLPPGTECTIRLSSADNMPIKVTGFRIMEKSELPLEMR